MAQVTAIQLPSGWVKVSGGPVFDTTRTGRPGRMDINLNDPLAAWQFAATYNRPKDTEVEGNTFDQILAFFLTSASAFAFLVDDVVDDTDSSNSGTGYVEEFNGVLRLTKHYSFAGTPDYIHPITRPKAGITLTGGAAGGTVGALGVVTGASAGNWTGGFYRPMIFLEGGIRYDYTPDGMIRGFTVMLQENFEV